MVEGTDGKREAFVQAEGTKGIEFIALPEMAMPEAVISAAKGPAAGSADARVFIEGLDAPVPMAVPIEGPAGEPQRLHVSRCTRVQTSANYGSRTVERDFGPGTPTNTVWRWVTGPNGFAIPDADAADLVLQVCGSEERPDDDVHIGTLTTAPACAVCFDLVPRHRVEG